MTTKSDISRRDLLKKSAIAGGVAWTAPMLFSAPAAAEYGPNCNTCDGVTLYAKFAPGDSQTCDNQCLAPPVDAVSTLKQGQESGLECLAREGILKIDSVTTDDRKAFADLGVGVELVRTAFKASSTCYMVTCVENFATIFSFGQSANALPNMEPKTTSFQPDEFEPPLFTLTQADNTTCGFNNGLNCTKKIKRIDYNSHAFSDANGVKPVGSPSGQNPLNFIEILLCVKNTSKISCKFALCH